MGGHPYWYHIETEAPPAFALQLLRRREFTAGRYAPVIEYPEFPITDDSPTPGPAHDTIDEVMDSIDESGTRSILDIIQLSDDEDEPCTASPFSEPDLQRHLGTTAPTVAQLESNQDYFDDIARGTCRYCRSYDEAGEPLGYVLAGYSFD